MLDANDLSSLYVLATVLDAAFEENHDESQSEPTSLHEMQAPGSLQSAVTRLASGPDGACRKST